MVNESGLSTAPLNGAEFEVKQMFTAPGTVTITGLEATGVVLSQYSSILRVGVSTNGVDLLSEAETPAGESFNGTLAVDLGSLPMPIETAEFYVHLFLTGSYGNIKSYTITGTTN